MIAFIHLDRSDAALSERAARVVVWLHHHGVARVVAAAAPGVVLAGLSDDDSVEITELVDPQAVASALRDLALDPGAGPIVVVDVARWGSFDLRVLLSEHAESPAIATLATRSVVPGAQPAEGERRVDVDRTGRVLCIVPADRDGDLTLASIGCSVVELDLLRHVPAEGPFGLESDLFGLVLRHGGILSSACVDVEDDRAAGRGRAQVALR